MTYGIVQMCTIKVLQCLKWGIHNQTDCYVSRLHSIPAMNRDWELFRRPLLNSLFQGLEGKYSGTIHLGIPEDRFQDLEVYTNCFAQSLNLQLLPFWSLSWHLACAYPFCIHSPPLQLFWFIIFVFLLPLHPLYLTVTLLPLLPLAIICQLYSCSFLAELHRHVGTWMTPSWDTPVSTELVVGPKGRNAPSGLVWNCLDLT